MTTFISQNARLTQEKGLLRTALTSNFKCKVPAEGGVRKSEKALITWAAKSTSARGSDRFLAAEYSAHFRSPLPRTNQGPASTPNISEAPADASLGVTCLPQRNSYTTHDYFFNTQQLTRSNISRMTPTGAWKP